MVLAIKSFTRYSQPRRWHRVSAEDTRARLTAVQSMLFGRQMPMTAPGCEEAPIMRDLTLLPRIRASN